MTYHELLELYKEDKLDKEQRKKIEDEIEKQDAISEYLYEESKIPEFENSFYSDENTESEQANFASLIQKSIQKAFFRLGVSIFAITILAVFFIQFTLPNLVSVFYYNPAKTVGENGNQLSLDMAVYTDLVMPGYRRDNVSVEPRGYGNYDICIYQVVSFDSRFTNLNGKVEKGKLALYNTNIVKKPSGNVFAWFQIRGDISKSLTELMKEDNYNMSSGGSKEEATKALEELNDKDRYLGYVTLDHMMNYEDLTQFLNENEDLQDAWLAICTNKPTTSNDMFNADNIGFATNLSMLSAFKWDEKKYPNLMILDNFTFADARELLQSEEFAKTHFTSMLRYTADQTGFLKLMDDYSPNYVEAANYVQENGITVYGFASIMNKETALKLNDKNEVYQINIEPLR